MARMAKFTTEELWDIVKQHKTALTSVGEWNRYAKEHQLPHSQTLIKRLGPWNKIKEQLNLNVNQQHRPIKYTEEELLQILKEHGSHYKNSYTWNQYASKNNLPTHAVFEKYLGIEKIEKLTEFSSTITKDDIKEQLLEYFPSSPPTFKEWNELSKVYTVVSSSTIIRHYGSWNNMKKEVYK